MQQMLRRWLPPLIIIGAWAAVGSAAAQEADFRRPDFGTRGVGEGDWVFVPPLKSVFQQPRPDYAPLGVRMGNWMLEPELNLTGTLNDNVFADDTGEESDFTGSVTPAFRLKSNASVHMFGIEGAADVTRYAENSSEDTEQGRATAFGRLDVTRNDTVFASGGFRRVTVGRTDPDDDEDEVTRIERLDTRLGYIHRFSQFTVRLDSAARRFNYLNSEDEDRDRDELRIGGRVTYAWRPRLTPFVQSAVTLQDFGNPDVDTGVERDAMQYSAAVGTRILITDVMTGEFSVGAFHTEFEEEPFEPVTSFGFSGEITWNVTPLTSIIAGVERTGGVTSQAGSSSRIETGGALRVEREVLRNVLAYGQLGYQNLDFQESDRTDDRYNVGFGGEYLVNRNLSLVASYDFDLRDSTEEDEDFTRNIVLLGVRLQY